MGNSIKKNTVYNIIKTSLTIIFPLITFPYISRVLGPEGVGKINFGNSIISYLTLIASLGVTTYAVRECSKFREDKDKLQKIASQIYSINVCTTFFSYLVLFLLMIFVEPINKYGVLILIQSCTVIFSVLGTEWLYTAMEEFRYITYRAICFQALSLILMFLFVNEEDDYMIYAVLSVMASSGAGIVNIIHRRKYCNVRFTFDLKLDIHLKPILTLFVMILAQTVYCNMDITMLGLMKGDNEVGVYSTAVRIYTIINQMIASVAFVVMPQLSKAYQEKNVEKIKSLSNYSLGFIGVIGIPCVLGMLCMAPEIVGVLAGEAYTDAIILTRLLAIALAISLLSGFTGNIILLPSMREKYFLKSCIYAACINFTLNLFLIPAFGSICAAITTIVAELISLIYNAYCIKSEIGMELIRNTLLKPIIAGLLLIPVLLNCSNIGINALLELLIGVFIGGIVYLGTLLILKHQFMIDLLQPFMKTKRKDI